MPLAGGSIHVYTGGRADRSQAQCAEAVSGQATPAGHFIPEELPWPTADALRAFFG